jgi:hypothetical protein
MNRAALIGSLIAIVGAVVGILASVGVGTWLLVVLVCVEVLLAFFVGVELRKERRV